MKKLLLLTCILAISGITFAASSDEADLQVKAQIIKPLKITTKEVNFGVVAAGQKNVMTDQSGNGEIEITGEAGKNVTVSVSGLQTTDGVDSTILLKNNEHGSSLIAGLTGDSLPSSGDHSGLNRFFNKSYALSESGSKKFAVYGILYDVPEDIAPGQYTGTVKIKAEYDFNSNK